MKVPASIDKEIKNLKKQFESIGTPGLLTFMDFPHTDQKKDILVLKEEKHLPESLNAALGSFVFEHEPNIEKIIKNKFWQNFKSILIFKDDLSKNDILSLANKFPVQIIIGSDDDIYDKAYDNILLHHQSQEYYAEHIQEALHVKEMNLISNKKELESFVENSFNQLNKTVLSLITEYKLRSKMDNAKKNMDRGDNYSSGFQNIQRKYIDYVAQFEKLYSESFNERYHNTMGAKFAYLENLIDNSLNLVEEKQTKKSKITISIANINEYNSDLEQDIILFFDELVRSRNAYFKNITKELKQKLNEDGINYHLNGLVFNDIPLKDKLGDYILNSKNDFEHYIPTKRIMDYFSGSRQYVMIVIMMMSLFGLRNVLTKHSEIYFPVIIILLGLGTYGIINQSKVEDQEARRKAIENAKSYLISELKNKISNVDSMLQKHFIKDLRDQVNEIFSKVDTETKMKQKANSIVSSDEIYSSSPERIAEKLQDFLVRSSETKEKIRSIIASMH
jgi:hypothetical protein